MYMNLPGKPTDADLDKFPHVLLTGPHVRDPSVLDYTHPATAGDPTWAPDPSTEFRQPLQVQSHLEMPRILVQLGHTQRTQKLAPQTDPKWSPTWSLTRF